MLLGWSVTSPTLRSVRRSSELSGPTLVNTSNVVLKATVMPEWRKMFEAEDSGFGGGPRCHGSAFFHGNGCPGASHLGTGDHGPRTHRSRPRSIPVNAMAAGHHFHLDVTYPNCRMTQTRRW